MKKIEVTVKAFLLQLLSDAFSKLEVEFGGITAIEVRKWNHQDLLHRSHHEPRPDSMIKIEIVTTNDRVDLLVETIKKVCAKNRCHQTPGKFGDEIFITPVEEAVRIRTGETNENAI